MNIGHYAKAITSAAGAGCSAGFALMSSGMGWGLHLVLGILAAAFGSGALTYAVSNSPKTGQNGTQDATADATSTPSTLTGVPVDQRGVPNIAVDSATATSGTGDAAMAEGVVA